MLLLPLGERKQLRKFNLFSYCSQVDISGGRKAIVINVPYRLRKAYRKIHVRLVRELEKKFSGKVIFSPSLVLMSDLLSYSICICLIE